VEVEVEVLEERAQALTLVAQHVLAQDRLVHSAVEATMEEAPLPPTSLVPRHPVASLPALFSSRLLFWRLCPVSGSTARILTTSTLIHSATKPGMPQT
jgi:hypothetical protein